MNNNDVSIVRCQSYEENVCRGAMRELIESTDGLNWVSKGMRIAVKANLVRAMKPEASATTHPLLICELVKILKEKGASVVVGDSPGGLFNPSRMSHVYDVTGLRMCEAYGAELNLDCSTARCEIPLAVSAKSIEYTSWLDHADAIIDFCKLKTHAQMGMSCAVKNMFGSIPGTMKPEYHYRYTDPVDFANALVDIFLRFKPALCICDAVVGMEGNGPTMGDPKNFGMLLASKNGFDLDLVAADLLGYTPTEIPTIKAAVSRGLCSPSIDDLKVYGDLDCFRINDVKRLQAQQTMTHLLGDGNIFSKIGNKAVQSLINPFPKLDSSICTGCGRCASVCPAKAITMKKGKPYIDRGKCIRCFCCQEFCPSGAMKVGRKFVARFVGSK